MVWDITRKEIIGQLMTARVFVFFIISTVLFIIGALTFIRDYEAEQDLYSEQQSELWENRSTTGTSVMGQPNPLKFAVEGNSHVRPNSLHINLDNTLTSAPRSRYENFRLPDVRRIDWTFIIQSIYALFCVVLTFDAVSGERMKGTLALMASNSVSRAQILMGKYLAVLLIALVVLFTGGLLSLAIINVFSVEVPGSGDILPLAVFVILSVFYISLFISMSLLASSIVRTSATALLSLLFIVIVLVFVVPNMAGILAGKLVDAPGDYQTRKRHDTAGEEYIEERRELSGRIRSGKLSDKDEIAEAVQEMNARMYEIRSRIQKECENGLARKQRMAETLSLISPAAALQISGESLLNTGGAFQRRLRESAEQYQDVYLSYVRSKVGEVIPRWQPPSNFRLADGGMVNIPEIKPKSYEGDMSDFPVFEQPNPSIWARLQNSLFGIVLLLIWNMVFFLGAHLAFVRSDIK